MIEGARAAGTLYEIHPYDLAEFLNNTGYYQLIEKVDFFKDTAVLKIGGDYYIQSVSRPALTKNIQ